MQNGGKFVAIICIFIASFPWRRLVSGTNTTLDKSRETNNANYMLISLYMTQDRRLLPACQPSTMVV